MLAPELQCVADIDSYAMHETRELLALRRSILKRMSEALNAEYMSDEFNSLPVLASAYKSLQGRA